MRGATAGGATAALGAVQPAQLRHRAAGAARHLAAGLLSDGRQPAPLAAGRLPAAAVVRTAAHRAGRAAAAQRSVPGGRARLLFTGRWQSRSGRVRFTWAVAMTDWEVGRGWNYTSWTPAVVTPRL